VIRRIRRWLNENFDFTSAPAHTRPLRRVYVSADGEVTRVEVVEPTVAPLPTTYPLLEGDAHAVDRRHLGVVLGTDGRRHPQETESVVFLGEDLPLVQIIGYRGWLPQGIGHGVPPGTDVALCGAVPEYVWLGTFHGASTERAVHQCSVCLRLSRSADA